MPKPTISLVITDLDDTLYDWLAAVVPPFYAMVEAAAPLLGIDEEKLLDELQQVHRKHDDVEYPFALLETGAVEWRLGKLPRRDLERHLAPALQAFRRARQETLRLYDGVREGLEQLSQHRVLVVAYTDSRAADALYRLNRLGIKDLLTGLYVPQRAKGPAETLPPTNDFVRLLPVRDRKPNPRTLLDICAHFEVMPPDALYVGDSLRLDIAMAKAAGVRSAWARYGASRDPVLWSKLMRVTHWNDAEIERQIRLHQATPDIEPDCNLERLDELVEVFDFKPSYTRGEWWGLNAPGTRF